MSGFTGTVDLGANGGQLRFNSGGGNPALGNASATFNLGTSTGSLINRNGGVTIALGALSGGSSTTLSGRSNGSGSTSTTYSIGGLGVDTVFQGTIANGGDNSGVNINKVGGGKLTLTGTSTYSGTTTVTAGTLQVDGALNGAGAATVGASGKLAGVGTITGATTVNGEVAPGDSGIGTLTFKSALNLAGTTTMEINRGASQNADLINDLSGTITLGGTLTIANVGGDLALGDSFDLFEGSIAGSFASIVPPSLTDPTLQWDLSQLGSTGIISVAAVPEPTAVALLALGGLMVAGRIRRRRV
jgi:autotransporter-associated beta strand protein